MRLTQPEQLAGVFIATPPRRRQGLHATRSKIGVEWLRKSAEEGNADAKRSLPARPGILDYKPRVVTAKLYCSGRT